MTQITDITGKTHSGKLINHPSELPKAAKFTDCFYNENLEMFSVYWQTTKKGINYFFWKSKI